MRQLLLALLAELLDFGAQLLLLRLGENLHELLAITLHRRSVRHRSRLVGLLILRAKRFDLLPLLRGDAVERFQSLPDSVEVLPASPGDGAACGRRRLRSGLRERGGPARTREQPEG